MRVPETILYDAPAVTRTHWYAVGAVAVIALAAWLLLVGTAPVDVAIGVGLVLIACLIPVNAFFWKDRSFSLRLTPDALRVGRDRIPLTAIRPETIRPVRRGLEPPTVVHHHGVRITDPDSQGRTAGGAGPWGGTYGKESVLLRAGEEWLFVSCRDSEALAAALRQAVSVRA